MFESILLGILQGLTEFLPVSSSGHLVLAQSLLPGFEAPAASFDVLLHGGTLLAVILYYHRDLFQMTRDLSRPREGGWRLPALLLAGSVPAGIVGVFFADPLKELFSSPTAASLGLLATGLFLTAASFRGFGGQAALGRMGYSHALLIGVVQACAIMPGISRSGATITMALFLGYSAVEAARFSFLLSLPAVTGALLLESGALADTGLPPAYLAGALAAAVVGWLSISLLIRLLGRGKLAPFAAYCLALGSISLLFLV
jgi:undecaprenyl-diphosphatase